MRFPNASAAFNRAGVGGRIRVAGSRVAFLIPFRLGEYTGLIWLLVYAPVDPSILPVRPAVSVFVTGTPVPSIST